ncbi:hypothetical protein I317_04884 [Kwoniella heveanensis CBS 569]|nr:hypothetical protein I317_04884 [Kwoniella heveanensis CBS 569]
MSCRKLDPKSYKATKNEVGVFTTPGYSDDIKPLWKFKNAEEAGKSAKAIWGKFEGYRERGDFVGMDICRKFIQMGRTRSLRYALRKGGRKYDPSTGKEQARTGKVYDQDKLDGANVYESWLDKCWADEEYSRAWEGWKEGKVVLDGMEEGRGEKRKVHGEGETGTRPKRKGKGSAAESSDSKGSTFEGGGSGVEAITSKRESKAPAPVPTDHAKKRKASAEHPESRTLRQGGKGKSRSEKFDDYEPKARAKTSEGESRGKKSRIK